MEGLKIRKPQLNVRPPAIRVNSLCMIWIGFRFSGVGFSLAEVPLKGTNSPRVQDFVSSVSGPHFGLQPLARIPVVIITQFTIRVIDSLVNNGFMIRVIST